MKRVISIRAMLIGLFLAAVLCAIPIRGVGMARASKLLDFDTQ